jgi:hypothetical protein
VQAPRREQTGARDLIRRADHATRGTERDRRLVRLDGGHAIRRGPRPALGQHRLGVQATPQAGGKDPEDVAQDPGGDGRPRVSCHGSAPPPSAPVQEA